MAIVCGMCLAFMAGAYIVDRIHRKHSLFPEPVKRAKVVQHTELDRAMHSQQMMIRTAQKMNELRKMRNGNDA